MVWIIYLIRTKRYHESLKLSIPPPQLQNASYLAAIIPEELLAHPYSGTCYETPAAALLSSPLIAKLLLSPFPTLCTLYKDIMSSFLR